MPKADDVSDPTDWLSTPVSSLGPLEAGLRCEICKDFYVAPVLTVCCHTFCSGCIRRSLSSVNASRKCPLCWAPFDESQLRRNKIVEELVKTFQAARADILALGLAVQENAENGLTNGKKRKLDQRDAPSTPSNVASPRKTRSQTMHKVDEVAASRRSEEIEEEEEAEESDQHDDGNVSCPICQQRMPEAQVFTHLDTHSEDKTAGSNASSLGLPSRGQRAMPTMTPLPTLSYTLLNDMQLRKKLRELGIPTDGNKQVMSRRHTEWRNLVNANCDSSHPKLKSDLLKELNQWERTQNLAGNTSMAKATKSAVMDKDFDRDDWSTSHNTDFQSLIAAARAKAKSNPPSDHKMDEDETPAPEQLTAEPTGFEKLNELADIPPSTQIDVSSTVKPAG